MGRKEAAMLSKISRPKVKSQKSAHTPPPSRIHIYLPVSGTKAYPRVRS